MYPQLVIAQYGQYLAAVYVASLFNPANAWFDLFCISEPSPTQIGQKPQTKPLPAGRRIPAQPTFDFDRGPHDEGANFSSVSGRTCYGECSTGAAAIH